MKLNVLLVSDQVRGIDGTGGLGDVATALGKELARRDDVEIRLLMPGYERISEKNVEDRFERIVVADLPIPLGDRIVRAQVCAYSLPKFADDEPDVTCYLLRQPEFFGRRENSGAQGVLLSRGAVAFAEHFADFRPDVIHCNDWHTGLIPVYLKTLFKSDPYLGRIATLFTAHNSSGEAYQGAHDFRDVQHLSGLPLECFRPGSTRSLEHYGRFNFAKGGFGFADLVNTVSLTYASEIRGRAFGGGLEMVLEERAQDLCGIVNGIDVHEWDPAHDAFLPADCAFGPDDTPDQIRACKRKLREELRQWRDPAGNLPFAEVRDDTSLIGVITRITYQKMPILLPLREDTGLSGDVPSPVERICHDHSDVQFVFLGNADPRDMQGQHYVGWLRHLARTLPQQVMFYDGFSIGLSHLMYAASELFLVPSVFEPCGLTQLTSMRYGTVPVVRGVGGLRDTVIDEAESPSANGFRFLELAGPARNWPGMVDIPRAVEAFQHTLQRASPVRKNESRWNELVRNGMRRDSSWAIPSAQYRKLYDAAVQRRVEQFFCVPHTLDDIQRQLHATVARIERLLTMPVSMFINLSKLASGRFGPFQLTPTFAAELSHLRNLGYVNGVAVEALPAAGNELSEFLHATAAGRDFATLRDSVQHALH